MIKAIREDKLWNRRGVAVDFDECSTRYWRHCCCGPCAVCGYQKHMAIHGSVFGDEKGGRPYGHEFEPMPSRERDTERAS